MSDAIPPPPRPQAERYRKLAKSLRDTDDFSSWARAWLQELARLGALRDVDEYADKLERAWTRFRSGRSTLALTDAQLFLARAHEFPSWPRFIDHIERLADGGSGVARFEAAADAVVAGDVAALRHLLAADPALVSARSTREHGSTLLHYAAANGVEDWRQRTPPNVLDVARLLLDAGADVNAESAAYEGRSTPLNLAATSAHPAAAGVQIPLMDLLLERGATIGPEDVRNSVANGRYEAAQWLAARGATLDLEGAAGVGKLDIVVRLAEGAPEPKRLAALGWAAQHGHHEVVTFLLDHGIPATAKLNAAGQTALHYAAYGAQVEIVKLLLARGASAAVRESEHGGTPLDWALHARDVDGRRGRVVEALQRLHSHAPHDEGDVERR